MATRVGVSLLVWVVLAEGTHAHAQCDAEAVNVTSFSFAPTAINTGMSSRTVTCTFAAMDTLSGIETVRCEFQSPTFRYYYSCSTNVPASGTWHDGVYACDVTIPRHAESGIWSVLVSASDSAHNHVAINPLSTLTVTSDPDTSAPAVNAFAIAPVAVNTSTSAQSATCNMTVSDAKSGVDTAICVLGGPNGDQVQRCTATEPASGTRNNGVFSCGVILPRYSDAGNWTSRVFLTDRVGNSIYPLQAATLSVTSAPEDVAPPSQLSFDFNPKAVNTGIGFEHVTCEMHAADSPAGVALAQCDFRTTNSQTGATHQRYCVSTTPASGTRNSGTFVCDVFLPRYTLGETWAAQAMYVDAAANSTSFPSALQLTTACAGAEQETMCRFTSHTDLVWNAIAGATRYNVYRGTLAGLVDLDANNLPDGGYGTCRNATDPNLTDLAFADSGVPTSAEKGFFYLVGYTTGGFQKGLGFNAYGLARGAPACP